jgi:branched-chain amino acid transport system ATP-binding protein
MNKTLATAVLATCVPTWQRSRTGLGWVPQERHMSPSLTVEEHLLVVARPGP